MIFAEASTISVARDVAGYFALVVGAVLVLRSKIKTDNLRDLKERVEILEKELVYSKEALEKEREQARQQHVTNREAIARLQAQVELYKDLQLKTIADTDQEILNTLKKSAVIANDTAHDGGLLVKTKKTKR